jgi:putative PLP-dependent aminotransferase (TIGR04422 family)
VKNHKSSGDVWPKKRKILLKIKLSSSEEIESCLQSIFTVGHPVILSSGRVAVTYALKSSFVGEVVGLFPYASQCLVSSVIKAGLTPVTPLNFSTIDVSYNQWGRFNNNLVSPPIIEDSVDSFYPANAKILRSGAKYELWSLSKIFGLNYGAVLWCKNKTDADKIKRFRNSKKLRLRILRSLLSAVKKFNTRLYLKWEELEHQSLELLPFEYGAILNRVTNWQRLYEVRLSDYYSALNGLELASSNQSLEEEGVIPVVIEIPKNFNGKKNLDIRQLHKISNDDGVVKINVFPYQLKL